MPGSAILARWRRLAVFAGLALSTPAPGATLEARSFGVNLSQSLINPLEPGASDAALRQEVAAILYDVRMTGGQVVRWIVTDVWPHWRCGPDPEDQRSGALDPAWYLVSRALLEGAAAQHVNVGGVLANLRTGGCAGLPPDAPDASAAGADAAACQATAGYYGAGAEAAVFDDAGRRAHLARRFAAMAKYLAGFPALAAVEMFNEPDLALTRTTAFWSAVKDLHAAIREASPAAARLAVFSGVAAWDGDVVRAARTTGALPLEPVASVHAYLDFGARPPPEARLAALTAYLRALLANKSLIVAEIGSDVAVPTLERYRRMLDAIIGFYLRSSAGVWVWGNFFHEPEETDFRFDFNHRSEIGPAFRPYFFADREAEFRQPRPVAGDNPQSGRRERHEVSVLRLQASEPERWRRNAWVVVIDGRRFVGFSRAGVFSRPFPTPGRFADPPPTAFLGEAGARRQWLTLAYDGGRWALRLSACRDAANTASNDGAGTETASPTPDFLLGLAAQEHQDLAGCARSVALFAARV